METEIYKPSEADCRVVRKWRLVVVGFYGSLLVLLIIFAIVSENRNFEVARTDVATAPRK